MGRVVLEIVDLRHATLYERHVTLHRKSVDDRLSSYLGLVLTRTPSTLHVRLGGIEFGVAHDKLAGWHVDALL